MKNLKFLITSVTTSCLLLLTFNSSAQNVGINEIGSAPDNSALLDIDASPNNNKGLLIPRIPLTTTTSNAPIGPGIATSLLVYNTATVNDVTPGFYYWDGTKWAQGIGPQGPVGPQGQQGPQGPIGATGPAGADGEDGDENAWALLGNSGTDPATNFLGTIDSKDLVFKTKNSEKMRITDSPIPRVAIGGFSNPESNLEIRTSSSKLYIRSFNNYSSFGASNLTLQTMGGTPTSPTASSKDAIIGSIDFRGGFGSTVSGVTAASIVSKSPVNWNGTTRGGDLRFHTINTTTSGAAPERMRIGADGGIGVNINPSGGNLNPKASVNVNGGVAIGPAKDGINSTHGARNSIQINSDSDYGGQYNDHSGYLIYSTMNGSWGSADLNFATSSNWGSYNTATPALRIRQTSIFANGTAYSSDRRLKTDINDIKYGLDEVLKMKPLSYTKHVADSIKNGKFYLGQGFEEVGFIAQDIYRTIPEVVFKPEDESISAWAIDYAKLAPVLVKSIQEQQKLIEELQGVNNALKTKIDELTDSESSYKEDLDEIKKEINQLKELLNIKASN